ncbi:MAG TPA: sigma-70 family RNA polymerase sigma factor [Gemmatimonadales bacterium]|jgi:RNA polymerase sigma factor (TIGR02999 family)
MAGHSTHEITRLLQAWGDGDERALERLMPLVYEELRQASRRYMAREAPGHTLQTTALVNEVYLRLAGVRRGLWKDRAHFFALCAKLMRRILTDFARSRRSSKRGGRAAHVALDEALLVSQEPRADLLALHEALERLEVFDHRKSRVVELRFYGGLSVQETADVLHVSPATVQREWCLAKDWLFSELRNGHADGE